MYGTIYEFESLPEAGSDESAAVSPVTNYVPRGRSVPLVGIVRNPRSHRNKGIPPELSDSSNILTESPKSRPALRESLLDFAARGIDYLVIDGGDGTVRDVLTCGADIFGDVWPELIVLPKGKTNALAVDLGLPNHWSLAEALVAARGGAVVNRRPMRVSPVGKSGCVQGFFLGAGAFTLGTEVGQGAHRYGVFNSFAVGLIIAWSIIQAIFGRAGNPWRSGTKMRLHDRKNGMELPHRGSGPSDERFIMVATTFEKFPLGLRLFGENVPSGLKLTMLDTPVRWMLMLLPVILLGFLPKFLQVRGVHRIATPAIDFEVGGAIILDGEAFPAYRYVVEEGPQLSFVVP